ncbi:CerR family C-terminal domain-containing protein [Tropicibacter sp. S64]|uniref:CerR family C-terminal domain-containing protein n=1 Tax=Tropicibacter sp. S64 TaxID=3415122 RepID=UPI003C7D8395
MPESFQIPEDAPQGTPKALLDAALDLFGRKGFDATSTREIAAQAQTNIASIAYHFGGKQGLHEACAAEVARRLAEAAALGPLPQSLPAAQAINLLEALLRRMVYFLLLGEPGAPVVPFILREMSSGSSAALDVLYDRVIAHKHRELCHLWAAATGQDAGSPQTRLAVFAALGQVIYFRIGLPVIRRRMGWDTLGPTEAKAIADTVVHSLRATIEASRTP